MRTALCFFAIIATVYAAPILEKLPDILDCLTPPPKCHHKTTPTTPKPTPTKKPHDDCDCDTTVPVTPKPTTTSDDCDTTVPVTKHTTVTKTTDDDCTPTPKPTTPKGDDCDDPPKPHGHKPPKPKSVVSVAGAVAGANGDKSFAESFGFAKNTF